MSKKIIGLLLALCMIIGLLPVVALADGGDLATPYVLKFGYSSFELKKYDTPIYFKNGEISTQDTAQNPFVAYQPTTSGASASNWTAKLEWKTGEAGPTLTLNGLKVDDFNNDTGLWKYRGEGFDLADHAQTTGMTTHSSAPLTIVLTGEDSLIETKFGIAFNNDLTIKSEGEAKLDINAMSAGVNGAKGCNVTINANLEVDVATCYSSTMMVLGVTEADITINGGRVNLTGTTSLVGMKTTTSGNIYINGGTVYAKGGYRGAIVPSEEYHLYANGGTLTLIGSYSAIYKGSAKGVVTIPDGADVEIKTGTKADGSNASVKETIASAIYVKITYLSTPAPTTTPTTEPTTEATTAPTEAPTVAPTVAPTEAPTVAPTEAPTVAPTTTPTTEPTTAPAKTAIRLLSWIDMEAEEGGKIAYLKNSEYQGYDANGNATYKGWTLVKGSESDWNAKFEWPLGGTPTLTLKNVKMDMVGDDGVGLYKASVDSETGETVYKSQGSISAIICKSGTANRIDLKIVLEGDNWVDVNNGIVRGNVTDTQYFMNVTITGAGKLSGTGRGIGISITKDYTLTIDGPTIELLTTTSGGGTPIPLRTENGDLIIRNATIICGNEKNVANAQC